MLGERKEQGAGASQWGMLVSQEGISHDSVDLSDYIARGTGAEMIMGQLGARPHLDQGHLVFHISSS